jgi:hypothetical protein
LARQQIQEIKSCFAEIFFWQPADLPTFKSLVVICIYFLSLYDFTAEQQRLPLIRQLADSPKNMQG